MSRKLMQYKILYTVISTLEIGKRTSLTGNPPYIAFGKIKIFHNILIQINKYF